MISPNAKAHMSPRDRMRQLAVQMSATADRSYLEPVSMRSRYKDVFFAIKAYYLGQGNTEQQWQAVSVDIKKFNQVWRQSLRLPLDDVPPPKQSRLVLPLHSSIQLIN